MIQMILRKIAILVVLISLCSSLWAQTTIRAVQFDGSDPSAEDTANFLIDNKFAAEVEYDDKRETLRLKYPNGRWGSLLKKGTRFIIRNNKLTIKQKGE